MILTCGFFPVEYYKLPMIHITRAAFDVLAFVGDLSVSGGGGCWSAYAVWWSAGPPRLPASKCQPAPESSQAAMANHGEGGTGGDNENLGPERTLLGRSCQLDSPDKTSKLSRTKDHCMLTGEIGVERKRCLRSHLEHPQHLRQPQTSCSMSCLAHSNKNRLRSLELNLLWQLPRSLVAISLCATSQVQLI